MAQRVLESSGKQEAYLSVRGMTIGATVTVSDAGLPVAMLDMAYAPCLRRVRGCVNAVAKPVYFCVQVALVKSRRYSLSKLVFWNRAEKQDSRIKVNCSQDGQFSTWLG
jgi:hypothetical protein